MLDGFCHASCYCPGYQEMHSYAEAGAFAVFLPRGRRMFHGVYAPEGQAAEFMLADDPRTRAIAAISASLTMSQAKALREA